MLKEQAKIINRVSIVIDLVVIVIAFFGAYLFRRQFSGQLLPIQSYVWVLIPIFPVWYYLFSKHKLHTSIRKLSFFELTTRLFNIHLLGGLIVASIIFFVDRDQYSRGLFLSFLLFSFLLLLFEKLCLRTILGFIRKLGYNIRYLLIVGTREKAQRFNELVDEHQDWGLKVSGFVQATGGPLKSEVSSHKVLGRIDDLVDICKRVTVDEVVFCLPKDMVVDAEQYIQELESLGVTVRMVLGFYDLSLYRQELSFFHNEIPILTFHAKELDAQQLFLKRVLDIIGALVGLLLLAIMFPFIVLAIRSDSPGPIFFGQKRIGESGRTFKCWKFRSMYIDAEERKQELMTQNEMKGALFKMKNDPRVT
ncbi:MAG: sugar transferase, partial [Desulfuromonadales bacterium]|nr:sugar transferase [Desulfuromonadales bacterium]